jgi:transposase InsO family protein
VKYAWLKQHATEFAVGSMCRFLQVSRSAYYDWLHRVPPTGENDDAALTGILQSEFNKSRATYGTRRLKAALLGRDRTASRRRIGRLMREAGLACKTKRKFKATTNSTHEQPIAPNYLER